MYCQCCGKITQGNVCESCKGLGFSLFVMLKEDYMDYREYIPVTVDEDLKMIEKMLETSLANNIWI